VVIAIIGILALIAAPSYMDQMIRKQIIDAVPLADIAKAPVAAGWTVAHVLPQDNAAAGLPPAEKIAAVLADVGFSKIDIRDSGALVKREAPVTLDLSSIAKGYGVDQVADVVRAAGFADFLVEIGGEVVAAGVRTDGLPWRVGINRPKPEAGVHEIYKVVSLKDRAFATSGDYRQFFMQGGIRYSHIIDPRTGYPVANRVVSVSILADDCTLADGLATAVMVMGADKGLAMIDRLETVQGLIVVEMPDGSLQEHASQGILLEPAPR